MSKAPTGLVTSPQFLLHDTGAGHPERAERLEAITERLDSSGLTGELAHETASAAPLESLLRVHPGAYVRHVEQVIESGASWVDSADVSVSSASYDAALNAAGGALLAVDRVARGEWHNAFVAARPPGHHAEEQLAMGFCLFNNVAVAARHLQQQHGAQRVAVIDWDVHHGNGTQHLFEREADVFYASLHQYPHYPGTGSAAERGRGDGEGATLNCPMAPGSGDTEWLDAFEGSVLPALEDFAPQFVLVSAGFDAHVRDPLSETRLSTDAYGRLTRRVVELAHRHCDGKLVSLLEGGYDLEGLASSTEQHVRELVGAARD